MRFITPALFLIVACPAVAAEDTASAQPVKTIQQAVPRWIDVDPETRTRIVDSWLKLDESTRPPFPLFRDKWLQNNADKKQGDTAVEKR